MKLTLVIVTSADGKTARGDEENNHSAWASKEDTDFFFGEIVPQASLIIMGSKTYEGWKYQMEHRPGRRRVIMTRNPDKYKDDIIPGLLEFTNENPTQLIKRLESEGFSEGYHVGGVESTMPFFRENVITDIFQTIEPVIFGAGKGITTNELLNINLRLVEIKKLNERGTLLLKYVVEKE